LAQLRIIMLLCLIGSNFIYFLNYSKLNFGGYGIFYILFTAVIYKLWIFLTGLTSTNYYFF